MAEATDPETVVERSRDHTERLLDEALDPFPHATTLDPLVIDPPRYFDDSFPDSADEQFDRWAGIGGANVFDVRDGEPKMLAVKPGYKQRWTGPGGDLERADRPEGAPRSDRATTGGSREWESLAETARREVREETNYEVELTGVFYAREVHIDYGPPAPVRIPMVVYTARPVEGRLAVPWNRVPSGEPEIEDARWFAADDLPENLQDRERIRACLEEME
ncbi:NUDIX domain-containing protein [Halorarius halobius]|uniref:NUDIX domain-containing protein n=1 Tax=Halorarius halobius TaxID=2962671 RepID=UPI0020CE0C83|nr:NUDIX domain-containing protein [Halorarius halobius]